MLIFSSPKVSLLCLQLLFIVYGVSSSCNPQDGESLLSLSKSFPQLNWSSSSWVNCCSWDGIVCDSKTNRVTRLLLPSRGLHGSLPPSILNLTSISQLNLSQNAFFGPLPDGIFSSLNALQLLDLSSNHLSGQLPGALPPNIQTINLSSNLFNGTIQDSFFTQASNLVSFNVSNNAFTGQVLSSICSSSSSSSLLSIDFSFNDFNGQIPQGFGGCSNLRVLRAGFNNLVGMLPDDIYTIESLQELTLPGNNLTGQLGEGIANLTNLVILSLFGNSFVESIPQNIGRLSKLEHLLLYINNLTGNLPPSLMNCTNLKTLNLRVNSLSGNLSSFDFSNFTQLNIIDLGNNNFSGELPSTLFACKSLTAIRLAVNQLVGEISPEITQLQSLSFLSFSNNSLTNITSALQILMELKNLSTLVLAKNFYNEAMPDFKIVGFSNLQILGIGGCNLSGPIPSWLEKLENLEVFDLSYNSFTGSIPGGLGNLPNLFYADFSHNNLTGEFPLQLTNLPTLVSPQGLNKTQGNYLQLPVFIQPNNASLGQYNQLANLPPAIYLDFNHLTGDIPIQIGQLQNIHALDLSYNNFSGSIPYSISNLINLETLDLANNQLSGEIPASLKNLHFLSLFSVANNNLQGPIPIGGQFDTFSNISFEGNAGLCSPILHRPCENQSVPSNALSNKKSPNKKVIIGLILGICFGVGLLFTWLALWVLSKRRIIPRGDPDKMDLETISFHSTSGLSNEVGKDSSIVIFFPNNTKEIRDLTITEILSATDNFSQANIVGCGGFGLVYKATLANGTKLAVKKLSGDMGLMEREFKAEVEALSMAKHKNLVSLQGYCVHEGARILIYSYMENGSLDYWLHEKPDGASKLDWPTRLKIAQGACSGLAYMHQICEPHIVHRDIKSSNILLDDQFEAYVADFGLSRLILPYHTHVTTELVGTLGYIPPEYSQSWIATLRGDVYSFGVVMLELLTGKRPMEVFKPKMSRELVVWVQQLRSEGKPEEVFDQLLRGKGFEEQMLQVLDVACMCVNRNPVKRPTINEVVDWLNNVGSNQHIPK